MSDDLYRKAERRADEKIAFYKHLYSFVGANIILFIINAFTCFTSGNWSFDNWWFYWITGLWGIGLIFHFLKVFMLTGNLDDNRDKMIEEEMKKLKK